LGETTNFGLYNEGVAGLSLIRQRDLPRLQPIARLLPQHMLRNATGAQFPANTDFGFRISCLFKNKKFPGNLETLF
jgi:hypothetical protein